MPIDYNEIKDNTGKIYLLKNGLARDPLNLDSYHPLSTTDGFMPHIEDGVAGNIVLANYRPNKKATWASHWFPLWYRGLTEKQITGEGYSRTFAQYFSYIPSILNAMNKNADAIMDVDVTIVQYKGDNLLGGYSSVLALETAHPADEQLNLDHSVAYVYDASEKGFYTSQWDADTSTWNWALVTMPLQSYGVQMKQYNTFTIKVQRGFAPTDAQYNTTWTDEQIRLTWQEMAYLEATLAEHTELLATFEAHLTDYENPHQVTAKQATFDNGGTDLVSVQTEEAIKEVNVKANANAQNIEKIVDGTTIVKKAEQDKNGDDIVDTYETKSDATSKLALKADKTYVDAQDQALDGRIGDLETANMVKSIARTGSNLITITYYDDTTSTVITLSELKAFIGEATTSLSGLMSATDKTNLNTLMALFDSDGDDVVNTIAEILAIFEDYPEGVDLVTALAGKVNTTDIVNDLTTGGTTKVLSAEQGKTLQTTKEAVANKATDFSTINDTKYPSVQAVRNYVRDIGLDTPIAELNNHSLREVFEEGQLINNPDFTSSDITWWITRLNVTVSGGKALFVNASGEDSYLVKNGLLVSGNNYYIVTNANNISNTIRIDGLGTNNIQIPQGVTKQIRTATSKNFTLTRTTPTGATNVELDYIYLYNLTSLGIDSLTTSQMDYWYGVYEALSTSTTYGFLNTLYDLFTSKASIAQEAWITPTLTSATTTYLKYRKDTLGTVIIEGNLTVTTAGTNFTLPTGYRPLFAYVQGDLTFNTNGTVVSASTGLKYINVRFTGGA